ncbi:ATP-binding protein [Streptomyces longispororuber]|uniref:ATP-binding protein n=1 Tax=Streptomyces longispororuber TaxID=68230 RepID=UPI0033C9DDCF
MRWLRRCSTSYCRVWDADPYLPAPFGAGPGGPDAEADGGRGLFLVCHYAYAWGGHPVGNGKLLWFEPAAARPADGWAVAA